MSNEEINKEFYKMADSFIDLANQHCEKVENARVGSSQLFATTRFCAFVVASNCKDLETYEAQIDSAVEFFTDEFKRMFIENLQEYKRVFARQMPQSGKYDHLVKKEEKKGE